MASLKDLPRTPEKSAPPPRALLEKFRLSRMLGAGGMGSVFLGELPGTRKPCAVKIVRAVANDRHKARLRREGMLLSRVRHPNLVEVYDLGFVDGMPWVAMEYVQGTHLGRIIKNRDPRLEDPAWIEEIFLGAGEALGALHEHGILHRDLKPGNIMVDPFDRPILMDLGLAVDEDVSRLTRTGHVVGTLTYIAPEVYFGQPAKEASDWYSLGIALYKALEGRTPFRSEQVLAMLEKRRWQPPPGLVGPHRNHPLARLVEGLIEQDPRRRITDLPTMRGALRRPTGKTTSTLFLPSRAVPKSRPDRGCAVRPPPPFAGTVATVAALALFTLGAALLVVRLVTPRASSPVVTGEPERAGEPGSHPSQAGAGGFPPLPAVRADWPRWVRRLQDRAATVGREGDHGRALRLRRRAVEVLGLVEEPGEELAAARIGLLLSLARDPVTGDVYRLWLDRARQRFDQLRGRGGAPDLLAPLARRIEGLEGLRTVPGDGADPFPPRPPPPVVRWALRSFAVEEIPAHILPHLVTLGYGEPEDFDWVRWAGDLRSHPLVVLARARQAGAALGAVKDAHLAEEIEKSRHWAPPALAGGWLFKLWYEHQYLAGVQAHYPADTAREIEGLQARAREMAAALEVARLEPELRTVLCGWQAIYESFWANGVGKRRSRPLEVRGEVADLFDRLTSGDGPRGDEDPLRPVLALEAGYLAFKHQDMLLDCEAAARAVRRARARIDWEALHRLGAGLAARRLLALGYRQDAVPDVELCRAGRVTLEIGSTLGIEFVDEYPAHLDAPRRAAGGR